MSKKSIYTSRLFKASKHQDKILAAISNPINSELVAQLSEYVDLDSIPEVFDDNSVDDETNVKVRKGADANNLRPGPKSKFMSKPSAPISLNSDEENNDDEINDTNPEETDDINNVTSSTDVIPKTSISSATVLYPSTDLNDGSRLSTDAILNTLNAIDTSAGVSRVSIKSEERELWIYYNDSINLNNTMTYVINLLDASGYKYLTFNRLARTDNAIVFDISESIDAVAIPTPKGDDE